MFKRALPACPVRRDRERGTYGTGEGGDVTVTFTNGSYLLSGEGKEPIALSLPGPTAGLLVDVTISGTYQVRRQKRL